MSRSAPIPSASRRVKTGIVGCGKISDAYFTGCKRFAQLEVVACADLDLSRATAKAAQYGLRASRVDELLADPDIELVVNLTIPQAHAELNERVLRAGKHVYTEKPFALDPSSGARVLALAEKQRLLVGSAPDTFLGSSHQTARQLLDEGAIGRPVAALAFMLSHGPESWHPAPEFYYKCGGGPLFDMGPYYLTALVNLLGPVARVCASTSISLPERPITSQPLAGTMIAVEVPTHCAGTVDFLNGTVASVVMSFDVWSGPTMPAIVIYGTEGTMEVPDPNGFDGDLKLRRPGEKEAIVIPSTHALKRTRGAGVADLACAILRRDRSVRCSGRLANHIVEVMTAFGESSSLNRHVAIASRCARPAMLPVGLTAETLDP